MSRVVTFIVVFLSTIFTAWVVTWNKGKKFKIKVKNFNEQQNNETEQK